MMFRSMAFLVAFLSLLLPRDTHADGGEYHGKIDGGVALFEINIRESGHTVRTMDCAGLSANGHICVLPGSGIVWKPRVLWGEGHDGNYFSIGMGVGYHIPFFKCLYVVPNIGGNFEQIHTRLDFELGPIFIADALKYKSHTWTPYAGFDLGWTICQQWAVCFMFQYGFSNSFTSVELLPDSHIVTNGCNLALEIDYYLDCNWSVNLAGGYNLSENGDRHGARGGGIRLGMGYTY